jgi:hypothetical protein
MNQVNHYLEPTCNGQDKGPKDLASYIARSNVRVIYAKLPWGQHHLLY